MGKTIGETHTPSCTGPISIFKTVGDLGLDPNKTKETNMGKTFGYARISTSDGQDLASQKTKLEELGAMVVFADVGNGSTLQGRDQLETMLRIIEPQDRILVLHPDRIARDTADLLTVAKRIVAAKAVLHIHDPAITFDGTDFMSGGL